MKRKNLSYDGWYSILSKKVFGKFIEQEDFRGYIGLIEMQDVDGRQFWNLDGREVAVCDKGFRWLILMPKDAFYCITAMLDEEEKMMLWYIDMIAGQGKCADGIAYFDDLYLDLIVCPDGLIIVDDEDELHEALSIGDITQEQFDLAIRTSSWLREQVLCDIEAFSEKTYHFYKKAKAMFAEA